MAEPVSGSAPVQRRRWIKRLIRFFLGGVLVVFMWRWFERHQVYHPFRALEASGADLGRPWEEIWLTTRDGIRLNGWFFSADRGGARAPRCVILFHGNAGNISHRLDLCAVFLELGLDVFVFDYRGYGRSAGRPGEAGTYADGRAAFAAMLARGFSREQIVLFGESLGGAVATETARIELPGGLILQSTFTSVPDIGEALFPWLPVRLLCSIQYETARKLPEVRVPVMILHSREDSIIPFAHGERLFAAAREPKLFAELRGDHNDLLVASEQELRAALNKFIALLDSLKPAAELEKGIRE